MPTPPATWDELLDIADALTDREQGYYGFLMQMPDPYHTFPLFSATGGYVFGTNEDGTLNPLDVGLNNAGSVRGLEVFDHLIESGLLPVGTDYNTMTSLFNQGRVGMIISGPWALGDAAAAGIDYGFTRIPTIDGGQPKPFVGAQGFMVSAFSQNKFLAEVFLKEFVVSTDTCLAMFARDPRPPAYKPALDLLEDDIVVQGVRESGAAGVPMPSIPEMGSVWTAWSDAIELVMNQELEPQEALDLAVAANSRARFDRLADDSSSQGRFVSARHSDSARHGRCRPGVSPWRAGCRRARPRTSVPALRRRGVGSF